MTQIKPIPFTPAPAKIQGPTVIRCDQKAKGEVDTVSLGRFVKGSQTDPRLKLTEEPKRFVPKLPPKAGRGVVKS